MIIIEITKSFEDSVNLTININNFYFGPNSHFNFPNFFNFGNSLHFPQGWVIHIPPGVFHWNHPPPPIPEPSISALMIAGTFIVIAAVKVRKTLKSFKNKFLKM